MFSSRVPLEEASNRWSALLAERRASGAEILDLTDANPTRVGLTASIESLGALRGADAARYEPDPLGLASARDAVAAYLAERGTPAPASRICLTSGTSEACAHLLRLLADPGDRVLIPRPSYPLYEPLARSEGVRTASYRLAWDGAWHLDFDSLERAADYRTRAVFVVQPNHPTGSVLSPAEIAALEGWCATREIAIVADEVFGDFGWDRDRPVLPSLLGERAVPTFVLGGVSKACGLPQMKLSWIAACGPARACDRAMAGLEWLGDLFLSVSTPAQLELPAWLMGRSRFQTRVRERIEANRGILAEALRRHPVLGALPAAGGWVAVLRVPSRRSDEAWALELLNRGVAVHPGHFYDFEEQGCLVVSLIVEPAVFRAGLEDLAALVTEAS